MDEWMDNWTHKWMDGWMDGLANNEVSLFIYSLIR